MQQKEKERGHCLQWITHQWVFVCAEKYIVAVIER